MCTQSTFTAPSCPANMSRGSADGAAMTPKDLVYLGGRLLSEGRLSQAESAYDSARRSGDYRVGCGGRVRAWPRVNATAGARAKRPRRLATRSRPVTSNTAQTLLTISACG